MPLDETEVQQIINQAIREANQVFQLRVDQALRDASYARGTADAAKASIESSNRGLAIELNNTAGRLDNALSKMHDEVHNLNAQVALNNQALKTMQGNIYGESNTNVPNIKRDIDRLLLQHTAMQTSLTDINHQLTRLAGLEVEMSQLRQDMAVWVTLQRVIRLSGDKLLKPFWQLFERYKWVRILVPFAGTAGALIYEYIKALIEAAQ